MLIARVGESTVTFLMDVRPLAKQRLAPYLVYDLISEVVRTREWDGDALS